MSLLDMTVDTGTQVVAFRANNAPEMELAINNWLQDDDHAGLNIFDIQLVGGGAAPNFLAAITVGTPEGATVINYAVSDTTAIVRGGMDGDSVDAVAMAVTLGVAIQDSGAGGLAKAEIACGGVGPHWMGLGLVLP